MNDVVAQQLEMPGMNFFAVIPPIVSLAPPFIAWVIFGIGKRQLENLAHVEDGGILLGRNGEVFETVEWVRISKAREIYENAVQKNRTRNFMIDLAILTHPGLCAVSAFMMSKVFIGTWVPPDEISGFRLGGLAILHFWIASPPLAVLLAIAGSTVGFAAFYGHTRSFDAADRSFLHFVAVVLRRHRIWYGDSPSAISTRRLAFRRAARLEFCVEFSIWRFAFGTIVGLFFTAWVVLSISFFTLFSQYVWDEEVAIAGYIASFFGLVLAISMPVYLVFLRVHSMSILSRRSDIKRFFESISGSDLDDKEDYLRNGARKKKIVNRLKLMRLAILERNLN